LPGVSKNSITEETCFDALKRLGLMATRAPTHESRPRIRDVEALLLAQTGRLLAVRAAHGRPCIGGAIATERYGVRKPNPDRADALQYACLVHGGNHAD
jgi:hypothetical protein